MDFLQNTNEIKENKGYIIDSRNFREGDTIKVVITYFLSEDTEKTFTKEITLEK